MRWILLPVALTALLFSCNNQGMGELRAYHVMKLPSRDRKSAFYTYYLEYERAKAGETRMAIFDDTSRFDPFADDFFPDSTGIHYTVYGWSGDTVKINCLLRNEAYKGHQPFQRVTKKWKKWFYELAYYYSTLDVNPEWYYVDSMAVKEDSVTFSVKDPAQQSIAFTAAKGEINLLLGDSVVQVSRLNIPTDQSLPNLHNYNLRPGPTTSFAELRQAGVFIEQPSTHLRKQE